MYGASIGIKPQNSSKLRAKVKKGFSISAFRRLRKKLGISEKDLAILLNIPVSTLSCRKSQGKLNSDESDKLLRIARIYDQALEVFGDPELSRKWLQEPAFALGDIPPLQYADTEIGAQEVMDLLGRIQHGVFS